MHFERIDYSSLNSRQKEIFNFQKVAGVLADYGFNCIKLTDDWQGADFLAYHKDGTGTLKVQLKSRATIDQKYLGKSLWLAFPSAGDWYLVEHDTLADLAEKLTNWKRTASWQKKGCYHAKRLPHKLANALCNEGRKLGD